MAKIRTNYTLYDDTISNLEKIKKDNNLKSVSAAIDFVVSQYNNNDNDKLNKIGDVLLTKIEEKYSNMFTRIRLGSSTADKNSQVILEILNNMILNMNMEDVFSSEVIESNIVKESKNTVNDRIARYKQIKDNKANKVK
jgi:hypothetical protein